MMMMTMTAVKIIPTELLRTVIDVGTSVYVVTVALFTVEMGVAKAVLKGDEVWMDMYSGELTNVTTVGLSDWLIPGPTSAVLVINGVKITLLV